MASSFRRAHAVVHRWIERHGWIELGRDHYSRSPVRVLGEGGMIWESTLEHQSLP